MRKLELGRRVLRRFPRVAVIAASILVFGGTRHVLEAKVRSTRFEAERLVALTETSSSCSSSSSWSGSSGSSWSSSGSSWSSWGSSSSSWGGGGWSSSSWWSSSFALDKQNADGTQPPNGGRKPNAKPHTVH